MADKPSVVAKALSAVRTELGRRLGLADPDVLAYCWVYEFPLLEWNEEENRWEATHNPFSGYLEEDAHLLANEPNAYAPSNTTSSPMATNSVAAAFATTAEPISSVFSS